MAPAVGIPIGTGEYYNTEKSRRLAIKMMCIIYEKKAMEDYNRIWSIIALVERLSKAREKSSVESQTAHTHTQEKYY